ncbi:MAG: chemotaxis protein CheA [Halobacteriovoraceae bacterium]|nr:chemotaxis protein CheA [Halobacteriovoraceae bacterium]
MDDLDMSITLDFICEAKELAQGAEESILALESSEDRETQLSAIFRMAHNIKGSGRAVGFTRLGDFVHLYEDVIGAVQQGKIELNPNIINLMLQSNDVIIQYLDYLMENPDGGFDTKEIEGKLSQVLNGGEAAVPAQNAATGSEEEVTPAIQELSEEDKALLAEFHASLEGVPAPKEEKKTEEKKEEPPLKIVQASESEKVVPVPKKETVQQPQNTGGGTGDNGGGKGQSQKKASDDFLRIRLSKLDAIIDSLGELLIYQSMLNEARSEFTGPRFMKLNKIVDALNGITKEMQGVTITLRMLPLQNVFSKMNRIVRELSNEQKKRINFITTGEHVELDKIIVDSLGNPLTHMIRNGIDHGIETPKERAAVGKPETATLNLEAKIEAGVVRIIIEDDGRGLNKEKILQKAIEKRMISEQSAQNLEEQDIYRFIMEPGFSTRDQVTDVSGRGVGMDVVRTIIEGLSGSIEIHSRQGEGTRFVITLPLSLSIIEAMLIMSHGERYIIPISQLTETIEIEPDHVAFINSKAMVLKIRDDEIPLFPLSEVMKCKVVDGDDSDAKKIGIVTIVDGMKYAFSVDKIIGTQSVVVKEMGPEFSELKGLSGSAILGDGQPGVIIDLPALINHRTQRDAA